MDDFLERIQHLASRVQDLRAAEEGAPTPRTEALFHELDQAIESLYTAESELQQQHEAILQAQQIAIQERERYVALFNAAPDAYIVTDTSGVIQDANHAAVRLLNVDTRLLAGKPLAHFTVRDERRSFRRFLLTLRDASGDETSKGLEFSLNPRQGTEPIPVSATVSRIKDDSGSVTGFRWLIRDISRRRRAERQLHGTNQLLRSLIDASPLAIIALDLNGFVHLWNKSAENILGWAQTELIGKALPWIEQDEGELFRQVQQATLAREQRRDVETALARRDGAAVPVRLASAPVYEPGFEVVGTLIMIADMSEEQEHRAELRDVKTRLASTRDIERRRLAQDLHDDVVQQLVGLQFQLVHLRNLTHDDAHLEEVQSGLSQVGSDLGGIVRMLRVVISDLRPPGLEEFGLKESVDNFCDQMRNTWLPPAPEIETELPEEDSDLPVPVATVLLRVVQEGLRNVRRHAKAGQVRVRLDCTSERATVRIEDDGVGFEVPPRLSSLAAGGHFGLLGLAEQVESMGGALEVTASPASNGHVAHGTTLSAAIPLVFSNAAVGVE